MVATIQRRIRPPQSHPSITNVAPVYSVKNRYVIAMLAMSAMNQISEFISNSFPSKRGPRFTVGRDVEFGHVAKVAVIDCIHEGR